MGVTREVIKQGTGAEKPRKGDEVTVEYTGYLYDDKVGPEKNYRGRKYVQPIPR
jgi:FK506-binding protein 1